MMKISIVNEPVVQAALKRKRGAIMEALVKKLTSLMLRLERKIAGEELQGGVLQHRSGTLSGSVHAIPARVQGSAIIAGVEAAGGTAKYGLVHEYGGTHAYEIVPVNKQSLFFMIGGKAVFAKRVMHPPMPKRPFMAPALESMRATIINELQQTLGEVIVNG